MKLLTFLETVYFAEHELTEPSRKQLRYAVNAFAKFLDCEPEFNHLTQQHLDAFEASLRETFKPNTAKKRTSGVNTIWHAAWRLRYLDRKPKRRIAPHRTTDVEVGPDCVLLGLSEFWRTVYFPLRLGDASDSTIRNYHATFVRFDEYLGYPATVADLTDEKITGFMHWFVQQGNAPRSSNNKASYLLAIARLAAKKHLLRCEPVVKFLKVELKVPRAWTPSEFAKILAACDQETEEIEGVPSALWWRTLLLVLYDSGLRVTSTLMLRWNDLMLDRTPPVLVCSAEHSKVRAEEVKTLHPSTAALLRMLKDYSPPLPFWHTWDTWGLYRTFRRIIQRAGFDATRRDMFHKIRKTSGTLAEIHCGPGSAQRHLGHTSSLHTLRYLDQTQLPMLDVAGAIPRPELEGIK